jgi:hypothetical protein
MYNHVVYFILKVNGEIEKCYKVIKDVPKKCSKITKKTIQR